jgi:signal transduction histidine kinase
VWFLVAAWVAAGIAVVWVSWSSSVDAAERRASGAARLVANGLRGNAERLAGRLAALPTDCSAAAPMAIGGYLVAEDGRVRCSHDLSDEEVQIAPRRPGLRLDPRLAGRAAVGARSDGAVVVAVVPASELLGERTPGAMWAVLGPGPGGRASVPVLPATLRTTATPAEAVAVGDATVVGYAPPVTWWRVVVPGLVLVLPAVALVLLAVRVVVPLERLAARRAPGRGACREVAALDGELERAEADRRATVLTLERAREESRRRVAVELHDAPVQELAAANLLIGGMAASGDWSRAGDVQAAVRRAMGDLRRLSAELLPVPVGRIGFTRALLDRVEELRDDHPGIAVEVEVQDPPAFDEAVDGPMAVLLLRNTLEALRNALAHSGGSRVAVSFRLDRAGGRPVARVAVADDGRGIDAVARDTAERDGHIGLASMRSYVESVGGALEIEAAEGGGTRLAMTVPLDGAPSPDRVGT